MNDSTKIPFFIARIESLNNLVLAMCRKMLIYISIAYEAHPEGKEDFLQDQKWVEEIQRTILESQIKTL